MGPVEMMLKDQWRNVIEEFMLVRQHSLRDIGMRGPGMLIMHYLDVNGPQNLSDISTCLGVTRPTVTIMVDNLEKKGLLERRKEGLDRRSYYIHLTRKGKDKIKKMNQVMDRLLEYLVSELSVDEIHVLHSSLNKIEMKLQSISDEFAEKK